MLKDVFFIYRASFDYVLKKIYDDLNINKPFKIEYN